MTYLICFLILWACCERVLIFWYMSKVDMRIEESLSMSEKCSRFLKRAFNAGIMAIILTVLLFIGLKMM